MYTHTHTCTHTRTHTHTHARTHTRCHLPSIGSIPECDGDKLFNTCTVFNPEGEMVAKYRKVCQLAISCVSLVVHVIYNGHFVTINAQAIINTIGQLYMYLYHWSVILVPLVGCRSYCISIIGWSYHRYYTLRSQDWKWATWYMYDSHSIHSCESRQCRNDWRI